MKYKKGDKVIVELEEMDVDCLEGNESLDLDPCQFLGKLEDFTKPKKIKMTVEEKKEFDELLERHPGADLNGFLNAIWNNSGDYSDLGKRLFVNANLIVDRKKQFEFARALENPGLIEVEKPKKYYVHLFTGECGYLIYFENDKRYVIDAKKIGGQSSFTKDEIKEINNKHSTFEIKLEALEEAEEDE